MQIDLDDWLFKFMTKHQMRYRPFDWPDLTSDEGIMMVEVWSLAFRNASVSEADADRASISLGAAPPRYRSEHLPAILKAVGEIRQERSSRYRTYQTHQPSVRPEDRFVWPAEVPRGDILKLCEHLTRTGPGRAG